MELKKEIEEILNILKENGHSRGMIEEKLGYSVNAIDQSLSRGGSEKLKKGLLVYKDAVLNNSTSRGTVPVNSKADKEWAKVIGDLTESNRILAESNRILADGQMLLIKQLNLGKPYVTSSTFQAEAQPGPLPYEEMTSGKQGNQKQKKARSGR